MEIERIVGMSRSQGSENRRRRREAECEGMDRVAERGAKWATMRGEPIGRKK